MTSINFKKELEIDLFYLCNFGMKTFLTIVSRNRKELKK